jgi:pimeloyl-ACP methyl ester carboxylesterase
MASLPLAGPVMDALTLSPVRMLGRGAVGILARTGLPALRDADELGEIYDQLGDPAARRVFRQLVRGVIDWRGQIATMTDRAYLAQQMPMCVVWGEDDTVVPVRHASAAARQLPSARVHVLPDAGHFPHRDHPARFAAIVRDFVAETAPATYHRGRWNAVLRRGPAPELTAVADMPETSPG